MTTENKDVLATQQTQDPETPATTQDGQESAESQEVDWKARFEASEVEKAKIANDLNSERGRRTRDQMFQDMTEDVSGLRAMITAVANRTASGETDALAGDIATLNQTAAQSQATRTWAANQEEAVAALGDVVMDGEKVLLSDADIAELRPAWTKAQEAQDIHGMYRIVAKASKMVRAAEKVAGDTALKTQKDEAAESKKARDAKLGVNDLSTGSGSSSGAGMNWEQAQKSTDIEQVMANYERLIKES